MYATLTNIRHRNTDVKSKALNMLSFSRGSGWWSSHLMKNTANTANSTAAIPVYSLSSG